MALSFVGYIVQPCPQVALSFVGCETLPTGGAVGCETLPTGGAVGYETLPTGGTEWGSSQDLSMSAIFRTLLKSIHTRTIVVI